jgi:phosphoribosylamine--glycine ligase
VFVATDGKNYKILPVAKDYKRIGEGDTGPNTGGMGAVSPVPFADQAFMAKVEERIVRPTVEGLAKDGISYKGFLFIGLMNVAGEPWVIEYNVRMGDPETEVVFPRITSDVVGLMEGIVTGSLDKYELTVTPAWATTVVCVSGGYPGEYAKGFPINGLVEVDDEQATVFHAGTVRKKGQVVTAGGRVLAITAFGATIDEALAGSYDTIKGISFEGMYYRRDIGQDLK